LFESLQDLKSSKADNLAEEFLDTIKAESEMFDSNNDTQYTTEKMDALIKDLHTFIDARKAETNETRDKLESCRKENELLRSKMNKLYTKNHEQSETKCRIKIEMLERQVKKFEEEKSMGIEMMEELEGVCKNQKKELEELKNQFCTLEDKYYELKIDFEKQQRDLKRKVEDIDMLSEENECFNVEVERLRKERTEGYQIFTQMEEKKSHLKEELRQVRQALRIYKTEHSKMKSQANQEDMELDKMGNTIGEQTISTTNTENLLEFNFNFDAILRGCNWSSLQKGSQMGRSSDASLIQQGFHFQGYEKHHQVSSKGDFENLVKHEDSRHTYDIDTCIEPARREVGEEGWEVMRELVRKNRYAHELREVC
jgi:chromosome segregation ATPase